VRGEELGRKAMEVLSTCELKGRTLHVREVRYTPLSPSPIYSDIISRKIVDNTKKIIS